MKEIVDRLNENHQIEAAKKILESAGYTVIKNLDEATNEAIFKQACDELTKNGISHSSRGNRKDYILVSKKDLAKASGIVRDLGHSHSITVAAQA